MLQHSILKPRFIRLMHRQCKGHTQETLPRRTVVLLGTIDKYNIILLRVDNRLDEHLDIN